MKKLIITLHRCLYLILYHHNCDILLKCLHLIGWIVYSIVLRNDIYEIRNQKWLIQTCFWWWVSCETHPKRWKVTKRCFCCHFVIANGREEADFILSQKSRSQLSRPEGPNLKGLANEKGQSPLSNFEKEATSERE